MPSLCSSAPPSRGSTRFTSKRDHTHLPLNTMAFPTTATDIRHMQTGTSVPAPLVFVQHPSERESETSLCHAWFQTSSFCLHNDLR